MSSIIALLIAFGSTFYAAIAVSLFIKFDDLMRSRGEKMLVMIARLFAFILWAFIGYLGPLYLGMRMMEREVPNSSGYEVFLFGILSICVVLIRQLLTRRSSLKNR